MTVRRYYTDSYTAAFSARVVESFRAGERPAARLDETFFYPTSGGQPHDTGILGGARVLDVEVRESDGEVVHLLDASVAAGPVEGRLDWPRRFDHMQQHTGQHVLSQAFLRQAEAPTIGFHLGDETVSIDLGIPGLTDARIADAESLANEVVRRNSPVRAWFPAEEERASPLRSPTTPTMVAHWSEVGLSSRETRFPRGSLPAKSVSARARLTMATLGDSRVSDSRKNRPRRRGSPIVSKYPEATDE